MKSPTGREDVDNSKLLSADIDSKATSLVNNTAQNCERLLGPLYQGVPAFPEGWNSVFGTDERYSCLIQVIKKNPEWWLKWKDKISLTDEGIEFKEHGFTVLINNEPALGWKARRLLLPTFEECEKIDMFVSSVKKGKEDHTFDSDFYMLCVFLSVGSFPRVKTSSARSGGSHYYFNFSNGSTAYDGGFRDEENLFLLKRQNDATH